MDEEAVLGWDLGGAHVKVARIASRGAVERVIKLPCPLWQGMDHLEAAVKRALEALGHGRVRHAVTMTGELADIFPSRREGVRVIIHTLTGIVGRAPVEIYAGPDGLLTPRDALEHTAAVASANWHASAAWLAVHLPDALLVDLGSSTADLIAVHEGRVAARGRTDQQRLQHGELLYTGVTRTPVMALARRAPVAGTWAGVMAEHFATTADVHRLMGSLDEQADLFDTADGGAKTPEASARRLARMVGMDLEDGSTASWRDLADYFASCQLHELELACRQKLSRGLWAQAPPLVGAGSGAFLVQELARRLRLSYRTFPEAVGIGQLADAVVLDCVPALAVAMLRLLAESESGHAGG